MRWGRGGSIGGKPAKPPKPAKPAKPGGNPDAETRDSIRKSQCLRRFPRRVWRARPWGNGRSTRQTGRGSRRNNYYGSNPQRKLLAERVGTAGDGGVRG